MDVDRIHSRNSKEKIFRHHLFDLIFIVVFVVIYEKKSFY